jgi:prophage regulatory protein
MKLLDDKGLRDKGIKWTRQHRHRLIKAGKFPAPVKLGENTVAWVESEIDAYLEHCIAERDAAKAVAA